MNIIVRGKNVKQNAPISIQIGEIWMHFASIYKRCVLFLKKRTEIKPFNENNI
jgi:hypothetical protein